MSEMVAIQILQNGSSNDLSADFDTHSSSTLSTPTATPPLESNPTTATPKEPVEPSLRRSSTSTTITSTSTTTATTTTTPFSTLSSSSFSPTRPKYRIRGRSRQYFTPPTSPRARSPDPDFQLLVETVPQDPDIFEDAETDYFSSAEGLESIFIESLTRKPHIGSTTINSPRPNARVMQSRAASAKLKLAA